MSEIYSVASIGNILIGLMILVGGYIAIRSGKHARAGEIQGQVIDALKAEIETLQYRMDRLEKENARLTQIMSLIKSALGKRGLVVTIEGDLVTIDDGRGNSSQAGRIQEESR